MTSGRYQSRFLSFFSQQSLRLQDQSGQFWRQAKLAAVWGVQIFLYPLYAAFQTSRLATKQLKHSVKQALPQVRAAMKRSTQATEETPLPSTDTPIRKTLEQVQAFEISLPANQISLLPALSNPVALLETKQQGEKHRGAGRRGKKKHRAREQHASAPITHPPSPSLKVRGVATLLNSRQLVLVTIDNHLLDILTADQQTQLQRRMVWELADLHRERRLRGQEHLPAQPLWVSSFLPLPRERTYAIPPVRWFYQLMAWEQRGAIAAATNLFQESQLQESQLARLPARPQAVLPGADRPLRSAQLNWSSLGEWSQAFVGNQQNLPGNPLLSWLQTRVATLMQLPEQIIQALTQETAIVPYNTPASTPDRTPQFSVDGTQPWLTMESLFSRSADQAPSEPHGASWELFDTAAIEAATKARLAKLQQAEAEANQNQLVWAKSTEVTQWQQAERSVVPSTATASALMVAPLSETQLSTSTEPEAAIEFNSTWIEAQVTTVGYVKHPLEQLLEWLDRGMFWVEEKLATVWNWLRDRLK